MADPINIVLQPSPLRLIDVLQLSVTALLGVVAIFQAIAANRQAAAARTQAEAATTQADAARASFKQSVRPKLQPSELVTNDRGGSLKLQNTGNGAAHAVRWGFDREWHWSDADDLVSASDYGTIEIITMDINRKIVVEYHSKEGEAFTTVLNPTDLTAFQYSEKGSAELVLHLREKQRGTV